MTDLDFAGIDLNDTTVGFKTVRNELVNGLNISRTATQAFKTSADDGEVLGDDVDTLFCENGTYSLKLPPTPTANIKYVFIRQTSGGTITIDRNGKNINGGTSNPTLSPQIGSAVIVVWSGDATLGWASRG